MKLIVRLFFLLIPVFADCQTNDHAIQSQPDTSSFIMPSLSREWDAVEFTEVFKYIVAKQNDSAGIIIINNNEPLLAKVTDIKNYKFFENKNQPLKERISSCFPLQVFVRTIYMNYYQKSKIIRGRLNYEREIAAFGGLLFEMSKTQMELADEFMKGIPNPSKAQTDGYKQMFQGITNMAAGGLTIFEKDYIYFSEASICKMSSTFKSFYVFMYNRFDQDSRSEFDQRIARLVKTHALPCVRAALQTIQ